MPQPRLFRSPTCSRFPRATFSLTALQSMALGAILAASFCSFATSALADHHEAEEAKAEAAVEVSDSYKKAMRLYLESQGSVAIIGEDVAYGAANETLMAIQNSGAQVTEQMQTIVLEEALDAFGKHFGDLDVLTRLWAPVYAKHFSEAELKEMGAFFESPVGKKLLELGPPINQDGMAAVQAESFSVSPEFQLGVDARFREAGIVGDQAPTPAP